MDKQIHVICLLLLDNSLYWKWGIIRTNIRTNIGPANTNIRGDLWTANANANISKCCEYVFVPTPNSNLNVTLQSPAVSITHSVSHGCNHPHSTLSILNLHTFHSGNFIGQDLPYAVKKMNFIYRSYVGHSGSF